MGRFICKKGKVVTLKKGDECCMVKMRCPLLFVRRPIWVKGRLKYIEVQVVSESMAELPENIICD